MIKVWAHSKTQTGFYSNYLSCRPNSTDSQPFLRLPQSYKNIEALCNYVLRYKLEQEIICDILFKIE